MTNVFIQYEDEGRLKGFSFDPSSVTSLNVTESSVRINQSLIVSLPEEAKRLVVKLVKENSQLKFIDVSEVKFEYLVAITNNPGSLILIFDDSGSFNKAYDLLVSSELLEVTQKCLEDLRIWVKPGNEDLVIEALVHQVLGESA